MHWPSLATPGYDDDFVLWLESQIDALRERRFDQLDHANLLEELDSMVKAERHALKSRLRVLMAHLLKCEYQPLLRSNSWLATLEVQRTEIKRLIESSPSFARVYLEFAKKEYRAAVRLAAVETGLPTSTFPSELPYSEIQLKDHHFIPGGP